MSVFTFDQAFLNFMTSLFVLSTFCGASFYAGRLYERVRFSRTKYFINRAFKAFNDSFQFNVSLDSRVGSEFANLLATYNRMFSGITPEMINEYINTMMRMFNNPRGAAATAAAATAAATPVRSAAVGTDGGTGSESGESERAASEAPAVSTAATDGSNDVDLYARDGSDSSADEEGAPSAKRARSSTELNAAALRTLFRPRISKPLVKRERENDTDEEEPVKAPADSPVSAPVASTEASTKHGTGDQEAGESDDEETDDEAVPETISSIPSDTQLRHRTLRIVRP